MRDTTNELNQVVAAAYAGKKLDNLRDKILQLQTADKFRLTAALLECGLVDLAVTVGQRALDEVKFAQLFTNPTDATG